MHVGLFAQTATVTVDPAARFQTIEGWGTSLSWWADIVGSWPDSQVTGLCHAIADTDQLNLNLFQYNIGGGENPAHSHIYPHRALPGFKASAAAPFNWSADTNQRRILLLLNRYRRGDAINTAISYSPPYWMTKSQCSSGNTVNGAATDNLQDTCFDAFADYCTEVVKHYHDTYGLAFRTINPMNEPWAEWKFGGTQEGCVYSVPNQMKIIRSVYDALSKKSMLSYCTVCAMDGLNLTHTLNNLGSYIAANDILPKMSLISTHTYNGTKEQKARLRFLADSLGKNLWQTESGPLGSTLTDMDNYLLVARRIVDDLNFLKCTGWFDWQAAGGGAAWALLGANTADSTWSKFKTYYLRSQFSRYIKKGYTVIGNSDSLTLTAMNPSKSALAIVTVNASAALDRPCSFDLTKFSGIVSPAACIRTTATENCAASVQSVNNNQISYTAPARSVTTFLVTISGLAEVSRLVSSVKESMFVRNKSFFRLTFNGLSHDRIEAKVFAVDGKCVRSLACTGSDDMAQVEWRGEDLANKHASAGIYLLIVRMGSRVIFSKPIVW